MLFGRGRAAAAAAAGRAAGMPGMQFNQGPSGLAVPARPGLELLQGGAAARPQNVEIKLEASAARAFGLPDGAKIVLDQQGNLLDGGGRVVGRAANMNGQGYLMGGGQIGPGPLMLGGYTVADVHDPTELPTYLAGYSNKNFRHSEMCQIVPVERDQDKYRTFDQTSAFRPAKVKTTDLTTPAEITFPNALNQYNALVRRIAAFVPDPVRDQAKKAWDVILTNLRHCRRMIDLDLELDVMGPSGLLTTSGNWASGFAVTLGGGLQWGGPAGVGANSDPIADLQGIITRSTQDISGFWLNRRVALNFLRHHLVRDHLRSMMGDSQLSSDIQRIADDRRLDLDFYIPGVGAFHVVTAKVETSPGVIDYVMPDCVVAVTQPPGVPTNGEEIATAYSFRVTTSDGPDAGTGYGVRQVRVDTRGAGGTLIIVEEKSAQIFTGTNVGGALFGVTQ